MSAIIRSAVIPQFDVQRYRADFPALQRYVHGKPLVYFDNANTAQKPLAVIDAMDGYYRRHNANVSRAVHTLGGEATALYEATRDKLRTFINAPSRDEVIFTRGTTESINLVAYSWALPRLQPGDEILLTQMEHHANIVPWQFVCERTGAKIKVAPISASGELLLDQLEALLTPQVKLLALTHVSNVLGTVNPIARITAMARARGIPVLVDGSQAAPHLRIDVQALGCDFYAITGHKMFGPTGTGILWAKRAILDSMPPFMGGGEMIKQVSFEKTIFNDLPYKFEAGTPNIAGVIGLGAAINYINTLGIDTIRAVENDLLGYATQQLNTIPGMRIFGTAPGKAAVISFLIEGVHAHDLATILDTDGVAVRSGHHCAHPLMQFFGVAATARASLAFYNTHGEIDVFIAALLRARNMLL
jgi:cysteine desulfurase/selenocysteine lyase